MPVPKCLFNKVASLRPEAILKRDPSTSSETPHLQGNERNRSSQAFLGKGVLKICTKFTGELYWNRTSAWAFSCKFAAYFRSTFSKEHIWAAASKGRLFKALSITTCTVCQCTFIYHISILTNFFFSFNILPIFFFYVLSSTIFNFIHKFINQKFIQNTSWLFLLQHFPYKK